MEPTGKTSPLVPEKRTGNEEKKNGMLASVAGDAPWVDPGPTLDDTFYGWFFDDIFRDTREAYSVRDARGLQSLPALSSIQPEPSPDASPPTGDPVLIGGQDLVSNLKAIEFFHENVVNERFLKRNSLGRLIFQAGVPQLDWSLIQLSLLPLDPRAMEESRKRQYHDVLKRLHLDRGDIAGPYQCPRCSQSFRNRRLLKRHVSEHTATPELQEIRDMLEQLLSLATHQDHTIRKMKAMLRKQTLNTEKH